MYNVLKDGSLSNSTGMRTFHVPTAAARLLGLAKRVTAVGLERTAPTYQRRRTSSHPIFIALLSLKVHSEKKIVIFTEVQRAGTVETRLGFGQYCMLVNFGQYYMLVFDC